MSATTNNKPTLTECLAISLQNKTAGELMTLQTQTGLLVLIIWIQAYLQQLAAYGLVLLDVQQQI